MSQAVVAGRDWLTAGAYFSTTSTWRRAANSSARSVAGGLAEVVERCRSIQVPAWTRSARTWALVPPPGTGTSNATNSHGPVRRISTRVGAPAPAYAGERLSDCQNSLRPL